MAPTTSMRERETANVDPGYAEVRARCASIAQLLEVTRKDGAENLRINIELLETAFSPQDATNPLPHTTHVLEQLLAVEAAVRYWTEKGVGARLQRAWDRLWKNQTLHTLNECCALLKDTLPSNLDTNSPVGESKLLAGIPTALEETTPTARSTTSLRDARPATPHPKSSSLQLPPAPSRPAECHDAGPSLSISAVPKTDTQDVVPDEYDAPPKSAADVIPDPAARSPARTFENYSENVQTPVTFTEEVNSDIHPVSALQSEAAETSSSPQSNLPESENITSHSPPTTRPTSRPNTPHQTNALHAHQSPPPADAPLDKTPLSQPNPPPMPPQPKPTKVPTKAKSVFLAGLRTFLEKASGVADMIPEPAGTIVKAVADTGVNIMDVLDGVDSNRDEAQKLGGHISNLIQAVVQYLPKKGDSDQTDLEIMNNLELKTMLNNFADVLGNVHRGLEDLWAQGRFTQAALRDDNRSALEGYDRDVERAFRNLQVRLELRMLQSLYGMEVENLERRRRDLLDRLKGSDNGAKEKAADPKELLCLPGTRTDILQTIKTWIRNDNSSRMMWLHGVAGCGKTSIAATIFHHQQETFGVSAIFYFTAGNQSRCSSVICSLSLFLAEASRGSLDAHILKAIKTEQNVADLPLSTQVELLLAKPLSTVPSTATPVVIVVDALDEWSDKKQVSSLVGLLFRVAMETNTKVLITSRDEAHIRNAVENHTDIAAVWELDLDKADHTAVDTDIRSFLEYNFARIRSRPKLKHLGPDWPGETRMNAFVRKSEHLFQFAATALRFIEAGYPPGVLDSVLYSMDSTHTLQDLYFKIFERVFDDTMYPSSVALLPHVLICLVCSSVPISIRVIAYLRKGATEIEQECHNLRESILNRLGSFLVVPDNADEPIRFLHTSIVDFLVDDARCKDKRFFVDVKQGHLHMAMRCLERLNGDLKENIRGVDSYVYDLEENKHAEHRAQISDGLRYASAHWADHLSDIPSPSMSEELVRQLDDFASKHLLHWLEILAFLKSVLSVGHPAARKASKWCQNLSTAPTLRPLFYATYRFIGQFADKLSRYPLVSYKNLIAFAPKTTSLYEKYAGTPDCVKVIRGPMQKRWPAHQWAASHGDLVWCIAVSPDGTIVASGGEDRKIRLWDAASGVPKGEPLEGHSGVVRSLAFTRDGKYLVSSSDDRIIRIWEVETGQARGNPLTGHTASVCTLAISPDDTIVASGSFDGTIRFWELKSGRERGEPLEVGAGEVYAVAFTPDGSTIVCGCQDGSVRRWSVKTRKAIGEAMRGHTKWVWSVCVSPDGKMIASGSEHKNIILWDTEPGEQVGAPLEGHSYDVRSVAFSPDGKALVSGSDDRTIRFWDTRTGKQRGEALTDHAFHVLGVAFSPNGETVVSGSWDGTVRAWDVEGVEDEEERVDGHSHTVWSVAFTPDGRIVASGSRGRSIMLWSTETGSLLAEVGSRYGKERLQFSADGRVLREEWRGGVAWLWDVSGAVEGTGAKIRQAVPDETLEFPDLGVERLKIDVAGWIERDGRKWLWVPQAYGWYDVCYLFGTKLVFRSRRVPILDVASLL